MKNITQITDYVDMDEKCWYLAEIVSTPVAMGMPISNQKQARGRKRYRLIWVMRNGKLALYKEESPNPLWAPQLRIPGAFEETVGSLVDIADAHSNKGAEWEAELAQEKQAQSTLHRDLIQQLENRPLMRNNVSTFGPMLKVQRNGFPQELRKNVKPRYT